MNFSMLTRARLLIQDRPIESAIVAAILLVLLPGLGIATLDLIPIPAQLDFATYYLAAQAISAGQSPYEHASLDALADRQGDIAHVAYLYPPAFAALLRPLALIPFPAANALWFGLNLACYLAGVAMLLRLLSPPIAWRRALLGLSLLVPALHHTLELGQVTSLLLTLAAGALVILRRNRRGAEIAGGALIGAAAAIKLFPLLWALPLLIRRRWLALAGLVAALLTSILIGIIAGGGVAVSAVWLTGVLPMIAGGFASPNNQSVLAAITRLGAPTPVEPLALFGASPTLVLEPWLAAPDLARALGLIASAALGLVTFVALGRGWWRGTGATDHEIALLIALSLLVTPIVWYHYYMLMLIPIGVGLRDAWADPAGRRMILVGCLLIALQRYWRVTVLLGSPLLVSFGTLGALLIWAALLRTRAYVERAKPSPHKP
jgi:hypothetical protein